VDVTHSFYGEDEPGLVNAVLDTIAREVRGPRARQEGCGAEVAVSAR
jgi:N utilization substance protein B